MAMKVIIKGPSLSGPLPPFDGYLTVGVENPPKMLDLKETILSFKGAQSPADGVLSALTSYRSQVSELLAAVDDMITETFGEREAITQRVKPTLE